LGYYYFLQNTAEADMKYEVDEIIDLPRSKVIELFDSEENLFKWQKGLVAVEHLSGDKGEVGAKTKIIFEMGKRRVEMIETITEKSLPDLFTCTYEADSVFNIVNTRFVEEAPDKTRIISENEFRFSSIFMKLMGLFGKKMFSKTTCSYLEAFKNFAERGIDINAATQT